MLIFDSKRNNAWFGKNISLGKDSLILLKNAVVQQDINLTSGTYFLNIIFTSKNVSDCFYVDFIDSKNIIIKNIKIHINNYFLDKFQLYFKIPDKLLISKIKLYNESSYFNFININSVTIEKLEVPPKIGELITLSHHKTSRKDHDHDTDIVFIIPSYNRYDSLVGILENLQKTDLDITIFIYNDGSSDPRYKNIKNDKNIVISHGKHNHGKKKYWMTINECLYFASKIKFKYLVQIDDDFTLIKNFSENIYSLFESIHNEFDAVHYHVADMENYNCWGYKGNHVDGGVGFTYNFLKKINFEIDPISPDRWKDNENLSSGVWRQVSDKINKFNLKVYRPAYSFCIHDGNLDSKMNEKLRNEIPIISRIKND